MSVLAWLLDRCMLLVAALGVMQIRLHGSMMYQSCNIVHAL